MLLLSYDISELFVIQSNVVSFAALRGMWRSYELAP